MAKFAEICLTTDFSKNAEAAVPYAVELARRDGGKIWLVHVFDGTYLYEATREADEAAFPNPAHWIDPIYHRLQTRIQELATEYTAREGVVFTPVLLNGDPIDEIVKFIQSHALDCLTIATHGYRGISHALYGSVAERLVRTSPCPVLSVRPPRWTTRL